MAVAHPDKQKHAANPANDMTIYPIEVALTHNRQPYRDMV